MAMWSLSQSPFDHWIQDGRRIDVYASLFIIELNLLFAAERCALQPKFKTPNAKSVNSLIFDFFLELIAVFKYSGEESS